MKNSHDSESEGGDRRVLPVPNGNRAWLRLGKSPAENLPLSVKEQKEIEECRRRLTGDPDVTVTEESDG